MAGIEHLILSFIQRTYETIGWPGVLFLMALESACIPLPSEIIMPLAGWMLIRDHGYGLGYLLLAALIGGVGNTLGSMAAYGVGRTGGRRFLDRWGKYLLISNEDLHLADTWFTRYGRRAVFFSRLLPIVRTFISLPAGIARTPFWRFSVYTFAGSFLWSGALAYGGYVLGQHWETLRNAMRPFDYPIAAIIVGLIAFYVVRRIRKLRAS